MKMDYFVIFVLCFVILYGCQSDNANMSNPASVHCEKEGGIVEINHDSGEGICVFDDGTMCEEWKFFRGECPAECGECPMLVSPGPDFCIDGVLVAADPDGCGCIGPPVCDHNIMCPQDSMVCPDGRVFVREGPNCDFPSCDNLDHPNDCGICPENQIGQEMNCENIEESVDNCGCVMRRCIN